jgi:hypothetical protein
MTTVSLVLAGLEAYFTVITKADNIENQLSPMEISYCESRDTLQWRNRIYA